MWWNTHISRVVEHPHYISLLTQHWLKAKYLEVSLERMDYACLRIKTDPKMKHKNYIKYILSLHKYHINYINHAMHRQTKKIPVIVHGHISAVNSAATMSVHTFT